MNSKRFFCCALIAFAIGLITCFAARQTRIADRSRSAPIETITYLDTVFVVEHYKMPYCEKIKGKKPKDDKEIRGTQITAFFSNHLAYTYILLDENAVNELVAKSSNHIYNIRDGNYVVVKVAVSPGQMEIVEFVANLSR